MYGSAKRGLRWVGDLDVIRVSNELPGVYDRLFKSYLIKNGERYKQLRVPLLDRHIDIDVYACSQEELPFMQLYLTGNKFFNIYLRTFAKKRGLKLTQVGIVEIESNNRVFI